MAHSGEMRRCLEALDLVGLRRLWAAVSPHLPQPKTDAEALTVAHIARTASESIPMRMRAWSHRWLLERELPSQLPDHLKPSAERLYPRVVQGVGISVNARDPELRPVAVEVRKAMEAAVLEADADGRLSDSAYVRERMAEARTKRRREIFGLTGLFSLGAP